MTKGRNLLKASSYIYFANKDVYKKSQDALLKLCQEAILSYMIPCAWSTCDTDTVCRDAVTTSNCRDGRVETQITLYHRFTAVRG